jgi:F-type H+-transporting ATPase subunit delta
LAPADKSYKKMQNTRVASRYAKSLLDLAIEKGQLEEVYSDMLYLQQLNKASKEFLSLLRSPVVKADAKIKAINAVTNGKINDLTIAFTTLLINKTREADLPEVITSFIQQYKQKKNINTVKLTTAVPVSEEVKKQLVEQVTKTSNLQNIELEVTVDPNIIGGFVLQTGDKLIDASVAYDLKMISRQFENNDFIYKVR